MVNHCEATLVEPAAQLRVVGPLALTTIALEGLAGSAAEEHAAGPDALTSMATEWTATGCW